MKIFDHFLTLIAFTKMGPQTFKTSVPQMYNPCKQNLKLPAKKIPFRFGKLPLGIIMMKALGDRLKLYFQFLLLNVKQRSQK